MDIGHYETELILRETEADVARVYRQAAEEVEKKLKEYLRKYEVKDQIKREQLRAGEITKAEYDYWKTGQIAIGKRWTEMKDTLSQDLHNANNLARSIVQGYMPEVYAVNHNYATFQVEKTSLVDTSYTLYDRQTVERIIRDQPDLLPPPGQRMKERIAAGKDIAWQRGHIQSVMTQSILQGESIPHIAQRIARTMGESNRKSTVRYARTAATGAQNAGRVDAYKRAEGMGIELEQEWLATLDRRTRDEHRYLDGEHVPVGEPFTVDGYEIRYPGDPEAPGHLIWNCRCTLVPRLKGLDQSDAPRNSKLGDMSYDEWKNEHRKPEEAPMEVNIPGVQGEIGQAKTVQEVNDIMNRQGWFRQYQKPVGHAQWDESQMRYVFNQYETATSLADLTGCDLDSAKSIASSYDRIFDRYPQLKGKLDAPNAQPIGMGSNTYAWCEIRDHGKVQVNPTMYSNWSKVVKNYEHDISTNWHPFGTTAESVVTHEIGHAVDGLLAREGILGGINAAGEYRYASSLMRNPVMKSCGFTVYQCSSQVSRYASKDPQEWFAECFAEYITSANPRVVATAFGEKLEELLGRLT